MNLSKRIEGFTDNYFLERSMKIPIITPTIEAITTKATKDSKAFRIPKETLIKEFNNSSKLIRAILRTTYIRLMNVDNTIKNNLDSLLKWLKNILNVIVTVKYVDKIVYKHKHNYIKSKI